MVATDQTTSSQTGRVTAPGADGARVDETVAALRALRYGAVDEATRSIALPPSARASVSPVISAMRWGAVGYGLVLSTPAMLEGSYGAVVTLAVSLFVTTWRTILPLRLGSDRTSDRLSGFVDVAVLALSTGVSGGLGSPFIFSVMIAMVVVSFGWGYADGGGAFVLSIAAMVGGAALTDTSLGEQLEDQRSWGSWSPCSWPCWPPSGPQPG